MDEDKTDWKPIALALAQRVNFALMNLRPQGSSGTIFFSAKMDEEEARTQHWTEYFAEALEMVPGVTVDREIMAICQLPLSKRRKAMAALEKQRAEKK